ncbi:MAG: thioredoxin [Clostridia bacterium]|nr:thioredoxin [Clostridia bacterium]
MPEKAQAPRGGNVGAIQILLIVAAIVLIIVGAFNGSARDVLYKAINICTECVGLG